MMPSAHQPPKWRKSVEEHWRATQWLVAVIATAGAYLLLGSGDPGSRLEVLLGENRATLYGTVAAVAGSLLGFVLAAATIILTVAGSMRLNRVTESNRYGDLWSMFLDATRGLGVVTLTAIAALLLDQKEAPLPVATYALLLFSIVASLQISTCIWILENVTTLMVKNRAQEFAAK